MACQLCELRKPRRYCPGVHGEICSQCCGAERERTIDCPLDCPYLIESRQREKPPVLDESQIPERELRIRDEFVDQHSALISAMARTMIDAWIENPSVIDQDIKEALAALARTYKTRESGLIYETHPPNPYADAVMRRLQAAIDDFEQRKREATGISALRDAEVFGVTVFLQRVEFSRNNMKPRGRAFLSFLLDSFPPAPPPSGLVEA